MGWVVPVMLLLRGEAHRPVRVIRYIARQQLGGSVHNVLAILAILRFSGTLGIDPS
jgi:hypothetical protein